MLDRKIIKKIGGYWATWQPYLESFSFVLRAFWFFFPGILFLVLGYLAFVGSEQGRDLIRQSLTLSVLEKVPIAIGLAFWAFTSWYTTRILAYNDNFFYRESPRLIASAPRFIAYLVFTVLELALGKLFFGDRFQMLILGISLLFFIVVTLIAIAPRFQRTAYVLSRPAYILLYQIMAIGGLIALVLTLQPGNPFSIWSLEIAQLGALAWVALRTPFSLRQSRFFDSSQESLKPAFWARLKDSFFELVFAKKLEESKRRNENAGTFFESELPVFRWYNRIALVAALIYLAIIIDIELGRRIGSFAFVLLAFGILLGVGNFIAFVSFRIHINLNFILVGLVVGIGCFVEPHQVRLLPLTEGNTYAARPGLQAYLEQWVQEPSRKAILANDSIHAFPVLFVLADGGASRSGYWTANVLSTLHESSRLPGKAHSRLSLHLLALAGASGGSVGNTSFMAALLAQKRDSALSTQTLCRQYLRNDFLTFPLARMLGPELINFGQWGDRAYALERSMERPSGANQGPLKQLSTVIAHDFSAFQPREDTILPILCINTTRMQNGQPAYVSNIRGRVFEPRLDVLRTLAPNQGLSVSTAMILGARFPYFSPAGYLADNYYVDGGYFDNSGAGPIYQLIDSLESMKEKLWQSGQSNSLLARSLYKFKYYVIHLHNHAVRPSMGQPTTPESGSIQRLDVLPTPNLPIPQQYKIHPLLNDLAAPLITLIGSYTAQTRFSDRRLEKYVESRDGVYHTINLYSEPLDMYPMNWTLSDDAVRRMDRRVDGSPELKMVLQYLRKSNQ